MTLNRSLFVEDPLSRTLPNDGVAKVVEPTTLEEWRVLRFELQSFVCEGEYERGLERILSTFVARVGKEGQPAAWVSGFYGSGKSHLVRMLEFLWRDVAFPDGATARGLTRLPEGIDALLKELETHGRRAGGLWSAAGTLSAGSGDHPRASILSLIFRSAGLPERIAPARLVLWLKKNGYLDATEAVLRNAGRNLAAELSNMYVSEPLVEAIRTAYPDFAPDNRSGRSLIREQFPRQDDATTEEMVSLIHEVLSIQSTRADRLPCALFVFDEVQQYLGDSSERTLQFQEAVEACTHRFGGRILFVGTGQQALQAHPQLSKLMGRFTVSVPLSDADVEKVIRQVVLRKNAATEPDLRDMLDSCGGEIRRHLVGTQIAASASDDASLVADYPLLPVRRRFWERVLKAVDRAGAAGQLRTQLRMVHEAARSVAESPVGSVVGADFLYDQQTSAMLQSGALLRDTHESILTLRSSPDEGELRSRIVATLFLIQQLHREVGIRATADALADLLVEDLPKGSAELRGRIPRLLADLTAQGRLLQVGDEYVIQTREGQEWEQDYRGRFARIRNDDAKIADDRIARIKAAFEAALKGLSLTQGATRIPRKLELHFGAEAPNPPVGVVPIWVRDEWTASGKTVRDDAIQAGLESPTIFVFLPRRNVESLREGLASFAATVETLQTRPEPTTDEGREAKRSMETRRDIHDQAVAGFIEEILRDATIHRGGGSEASRDESLRDSIKATAEASISRLFPQFSAGDNPRWDSVLKKAQQGGGADLSPVGFSGDAEKQPVCKEILLFVGSGKKGSEIRKRFSEPPYGWPSDAIDGAIYTLLSGNAIRGVLNGAPITASTLDRPKIGMTDFREERVRFGIKERLEVRNLLQFAGVKYIANEEATAVPGFLSKLKTLAEKAGGAPPLPPAPDVSHLDEMLGKAGNDLLLSVYDDRDRLRAEWSAWSAKSELAARRKAEWEMLVALRTKADSLPLVAETDREIEALKANRSLLSDPDPTTPLRRRLEDDLREALTNAREAHLDAYGVKIDDLLSNPEWGKLSPEVKTEIRQKRGLVELEPLQIGTADQLLSALNQTPLGEWESRTAALSERIALALHDAARKNEPTAERVTLPHDTLKTADEVEAYVGRVRELLMEHIENGKPVVV